MGWKYLGGSSMAGHGQKRQVKRDAKITIAKKSLAGICSTVRLTLLLLPFYYNNTTLST